MAACSLTKYLQNQEGAVIDRQLKATLQIALLCRAQVLVKKHFNRARLSSQQFDFVGFATAYKQGRVGRFAFTSELGNRTQSRRLGEQAQLFEFTIEIGQSEINPNQNGGYRLMFRRMQVRHPRRLRN